MDKVQTRLRNNCIKINDCWVWTLFIDPGGYSRTKLNGKDMTGHRASYMAFKGEIPEGLHIDHLCRRRNCINPDHLEAVTPKENTLRGFNPAAINARKTVCNRGHLFTNENTYIDLQNKRSCRNCETIWSKQYLDRHKTKCLKCENITSGFGATGLCKSCTNKQRAVEFRK